MLYAPVCARITSVADVFDALTSERPYKKAFDFDESYTIIAENSESISTMTSFRHL